MSPLFYLASLSGRIVETGLVGDCFGLLKHFVSAWLARVGGIVVSGRGDAVCWGALDWHRLAPTGRNGRWPNVDQAFLVAHPNCVKMHH